MATHWDFYATFEIGITKGSWQVIGISMCEELILHGTLEIEMPTCPTNWIFAGTARHIGLTICDLFMNAAPVN